MLKLKMLSDEPAECMVERRGNRGWQRNYRAMKKFCHALNNVGSVHTSLSIHRNKRYSNAFAGESLETVLQGIAIMSMHEPIQTLAV